VPDPVPPLSPKSANRQARYTALPDSWEWFEPEWLRLNIRTQKAAQALPKSVGEA
jgi:hypothetical protein